MKSKPKPKSNRKTVVKTISLAPRVAGLVEGLAKRRGFRHSDSAYIGQLIEEDAAQLGASKQ